MTASDASPPGPPRRNSVSGPLVLALTLLAAVAGSLGLLWLRQQFWQ